MTTDHVNNRIRRESRYTNPQCFMQNIAPKRTRNSSLFSRIAGHTVNPVQSFISKLLLRSLLTFDRSINRGTYYQSLSHSTRSSPPRQPHFLTAPITCFYSLLLPAPARDNSSDIRAARSLFLDDYYMFTNHISTGYCNRVTDPYVPRLLDYASTQGQC